MREVTNEEFIAEIRRLASELSDFTFNTSFLESEISSFSCPDVSDVSTVTDSLWGSIQEPNADLVDHFEFTRLLNGSMHDGVSKTEFSH